MPTQTSSDTEIPQPSLHDFVKGGWHVLEPGRTFVDSWHIGAICEHLEAVSRGEIQNLLPVPKGGGQFQRSWFKVEEALPKDFAEMTRFWDTAATEGGGDWTAGVKMGRRQNGDGKTSTHRILTIGCPPHYRVSPHRPRAQVPGCGEEEQRATSHGQMYNRITNVKSRKRDERLHHGQDFLERAWP